MMPELYLADALGAVGKPMLRVHTAGSVGGSTALVATNLVQAGVHGTVLTLAFEKQSESEAMWALSLPMPVPAAAARRRGRLLRPARPRLHAPRRRARPHRHPRGAEGPPQRPEEPVRPPARARHHLREGRRRRRCCGTRSATRRPARRPTAPSPWSSPTEAATPPGAEAARVGPRHRHAHRAHDVRGQGPRQPAGRARTARPTSTRQAGIDRPASRSTRSRCTCRSPGTSRCGWRTWASQPGRGLEADRGRRHRSSTATCP